MLGLILGMAAFVAFITVVQYLTILAMDWLVNKIKNKIQKAKTQKVAVADIQEIIDKCENKASLADLEKFAEDKNATHLIAEVDYSGNVTGVEAVGVEKVDKRVYDMINRTGEGMVVIS